jgi:hypothetical protein
MNFVDRERGSRRRILASPAARDAGLKVWFDKDEDDLVPGQDRSRARLRWAALSLLTLDAFVIMDMGSVQVLTSPPS